MSHDDNRPDSRDRGAYTPPTDDDLPFNRGGGYDARRAPPTKAPPVT
ncbi:MAG: SPOR domain-containing protein, partial [Caulobacteraceae bacterium]